MDRKTELKILYLEDQPLDAELVHEILEAEGMPSQMMLVETREDFEAALSRCQYDLIFSDKALPQFDGLSALAIARERCPDVPYIFISGTIGEEVAIESLKNGATDYVLKQRLNRIVPVTRRALREAAERLERKKAEQALAKSEAELRALFAAMTDVIIILDSDGRYLQVAPTNPSPLYKVPLTAVGQTLHERMPVAVADNILRHIRHALQIKQPAHVEFSLDFDEITVWFDGMISPMEGDKAFLVARDVTVRKMSEETLRQSELKFRSVFETTLDAIYVINNEGSIVDVNAAAVKLAGLPRDAMVGLTFEELPNPGKLNVQDMWQQFRFNGNSRGESTFVDRATGEHRVVEYHAKADFMPGHHVVMVHEITELRKTEEARLAREAAEQANHAKSEFLSRMSHELRTPLNSILGFSELLQMGDLDPKYAVYLGHILKSGRHLLNLIDEVLDIARIEAGRLGLSLEPVDLSETIQECLDLIQPLASQHKIKVDPGNTLDHTRFVLADRQRLRQVLLNLMTNAVKYNRREGSITLSKDESESSLRILVSDTGSGVRPESMSKLFMPFERLGAEHTGIEGTGLGLALSKTLVEAMQGTIGMDTVVGEGSTFWIELAKVDGPAEQLKQLAANPFATHNQSSKECTVLYVEDNFANLKLIESIFDNMPHITLITAMQGSIALEMAKQKPDLILLDLHLPDMNGDIILHKLRENPETRSIPVVMISADASPIQIARLRAAGADDYLTKPLSVKAFLQVIHKILD